jgi:protein-S-isoprenylcysteine O-methyltransferase Ste14
MLLVSWVALMVCWFAWGYPFVFRAPHNQKRASITLAGPTRAGLLLESLAIFLAFACRMPSADEPGPVRMIGSILLGIAAPVLSWNAVQHLGRQFRVNAGLYEDHELIRTGAYSVVRHPIYASLLAILGSTLFLLTPWQWAVFCLLLFIAGTEIRVHAEDGLLRSRFGDEFEQYRHQVKAYIPFIR